MKRQNNTTALKVKFIPCTNTRPSKFKVTQLNTNKSIYIYDIGDNTPIDFFTSKLEGINEVENFSLIVDNSQNDYYLFNVNTKGAHSFPDLLKEFK